MSITVAEPVETYESWGWPEIGGAEMNGQHILEQIPEAIEGVSSTQQQMLQTERYGDAEARWGSPYCFQSGGAFGGDVYPFVEGYRYGRADDQHHWWHAQTNEKVVGDECSMPQAVYDKLMVEFSVC